MGNFNLWFLKKIRIVHVHLFDTLEYKLLLLFTWNCIRFSNWQVTCMFYLLRREIAFTLNILLSYFPFLTYFLKEVFHGSCNPALAFYCRDFSASRGEEKKIFFPKLSSEEEESARKLSLKEDPLAALSLFVLSPKQKLLDRLYSPWDWQCCHKNNVAAHFSITVSIRRELNSWLMVVFLIYNFFPHLLFLKATKEDPLMEKN